jgi:hypothetical protein
MHLDLEASIASEKGIIILIQALEHNQTISHIRLGYNNIGDKVAIALTQVLKLNSILRSIDLRFNSISDEGALAIACALEHNLTVKEINLRNNNLSISVQGNLNKDKRFEVGEGWVRTKITGLSLKMGMSEYRVNRFGDILNDLKYGGKSKYIYSTGTYSASTFQLNPFTFFSEHADRENALFFAQNHQQQLNVFLEKSLEVWGAPKEDDGSKKKAHNLQEAAHLFGFKCTPIAKDGNCLFEAISQQLIKILPTQKECHYSHVKLRELAVNYLMKHQEFYENFVEDHSFASFIHKMGLPGTWAENMALNALAHVLNVTIVVINSDNSDPIVLKKPHAQGIIYLGYEVNAHYQLLSHDSSIMPQKSLNNFIERALVLDEPSTQTTESRLVM